jgi:hypothetical protein
MKRTKLNIETTTETIFTTLQVENWPCGGVSQCFISRMAVCAANWRSICSACAGIKEAVAIKEHKYAPRYAGKEMNVYILSFTGFLRGSFSCPIRITAQFGLFPFLWVTAAALHAPWKYLILATACEVKSSFCQLWEGKIAKNVWIIRPCKSAADRASAHPPGRGSEQTHLESTLWSNSQVGARYFIRVSPHLLKLLWRDEVSKNLFAWIF